VETRDAGIVFADCSGALRQRPALKVVHPNELRFILRKLLNGVPELHKCLTFRQFRLGIVCVRRFQGLGIVGGTCQQEDQTELLDGVAKAGGTLLIVDCGETILLDLLADIVGGALFKNPAA